MINKATPSSPWYKEFYVWLILLFPFSAIVVGLSMLGVSWVTFDGLVVDDYYKKGLEINRSFERDKMALKYGLEGYLQANPQSGAIRVFLKTKENYNFPSQLKLSLLHRTRKGLDQIITLERQADVYIGNILPLADGLWEVLLEGQDWRLDSTVDGKMSEVHFLGYNQKSSPTKETHFKHP
jgi:uncharacterized protein